MPLAATPELLYCKRRWCAPEELKAVAGGRVLHPDLMSGHRHSCHAAGRREGGCCSFSLNVGNQHFTCPDKAEKTLHTAPRTGVTPRLLTTELSQEQHCPSPSLCHENWPQVSDNGLANVCDEKVLLQ